MAKGPGRRLPGILLAALAAAALFVYWGNTALQVCRFEPSFPALPEGFDGCRIVVLSDLHGAEFGEGNRALFDAVAAESPELIFFLGDLVDEYRDLPAGYAETVAEGLSAIAPTYYVTGNHEWAAVDVPDLKKQLSGHGAAVLDNEFLALERNGDQIVLAGIDDPNGYADQKSPAQVAQEVYAAWGDPFWLLLAHRNDRFPGEYSLLGADLVISGHGHGGLIRLPFTDGLVSAERRPFPSYTAGFYTANGRDVFVSRGLGNSGPTLRLFNRPEVAVLTLRTQ